MHNIEKSAFKKGEYVGYANGVWRIRRRPGKLGWRADKGGASVYGRTLKEVSGELAKIGGR